ncbi:MAG: intermembrane transport protein PqiB [Pseudomonadota bacterium]
MSDLKPDIKKGRGFNPIWIVPIVAVVVGIYMVIHTKMNEGPQITISFDTAESLEAGKTKIRFRDVDIGMVEDVTLTDSMSGIIVTAKMTKNAEPLLREDTRFWVVRARVGAGSVTGLGTLLSGAYIQLDPGVGKTEERRFVGLEEPPLTPADAPGVRLVLHSEHAGSLNAGDVIVYNGFKVGRIEGITFDSQKKEVLYDAFIDAPYDDLVTTSTRFWNTSGITVTASASGVEVQTSSMETILLGGVAFGTIPGIPPGDKVSSGASFKLNRSYSELAQDPFRYRSYFVVEFSQSLRGLKSGAPVEYRGIQIGRVDRIMVQELVRSGLAGGGSAIPVLIYLEPGRLGAGDTRELVQQMSSNVENGVAQGLRASLQTGNLITGQLYVSFDFYDDVEPVAPQEFDGYTVLPTIPTGLGQLEKQVGDLLDKVNALPLDSLLVSADSSLQTLDGTLASLTGTLDSLQTILDEESTQLMPDEINKTLSEIRQAVSALAPDSESGQSLNEAILELNRTLRNLEQFTRTLSAKPNSLIFSSDVPADTIPEASAQ